MIKKISTRLLAVIMAFCLIMLQTINIHAESNGMITATQLNTILTGVNSIVAQLVQLGFSIDGINTILNLPSRGSDFHELSYVNNIPFDGSFTIEDFDIQENGIFSTYSYNGNPPLSNADQQQRIVNIYGVAQQYYKTNYYEGNTKDPEDFGRYMAYLYVSHYIDGPGRAPRASDYPYIISSSDIAAYDRFLTSNQISYWTSQLTNLGCALYSMGNYNDTMNMLDDAGATISQCLSDLNTIGWDSYNTSQVLAAAIPYAESYIINNYETSISDEQLTDDLINYVSGELYSLNFFETYDHDLTMSVICIATTALFDVLTLSFPILGICTSVIPFFVYDATGTFESINLLSLQYSFSARYSVRTGIYLGM